MVDWMDEWIDGQTHGPVDGWVDGWIAGLTNCWNRKRIDRCIDKPNGLKACLVER